MEGTALDREPWLRYRPAQRWVFLAVLMLIAISAAVDKGVLPILFQPIKAEFGMSDRMLGLLGGAPFALCFALSSIPLARLADRSGPKPILLAAMAGWSVMTVLCGVAPTLPLLFLARMGVGFAEGGCYPPSHALIAEYFPPARRGLAFALYLAMASVGYMVASTAGGWLAVQYGWRAVFLATGVAAIPVAILAMAVLRDAPVAAAASLKPPANVKRDLQALLRKRSFLLVLIGLMFFAIYPYGLIVFTPTYMIRLFHMSLAEAGPLFGLTVALGQLAGSVGGGALADRLRARDERWLLKLPGLAMLVSFVLAAIAFSLDNVAAFLVLHGLGIAAASAAQPPAFAAVQHVCGSQRRATASAVAVIVLHAVGMALAPFLVGSFSDLFMGAAGSASLRYGILAASPLLIVSAWAFWSAARPLQADHER